MRVTLVLSIASSAQGRKSSPVQTTVRHSVLIASNLLRPSQSLSLYISLYATASVSVLISVPISVRTSLYHNENTHQFATGHQLAHTALQTRCSWPCNCQMSHTHRPALSVFITVSPTVCTAFSRSVSPSLSMAFALAVCHRLSLLLPLLRHGTSMENHPLALTKPLSHSLALSHTVFRASLTGRTDRN